VGKAKFRLHYPWVGEEWGAPLKGGGLKQILSRRCFLHAGQSGLHVFEKFKALQTSVVTS